MGLFTSWLAETKRLQEESFGHNLPKKDEALMDWIRTNTLAAEDELHEALNEVGWKPWATTRHINREAYIKEIVDALHFIGNLLSGVGCTDEELNEAYLKKMARNAERQREGYTGVDKCAGCGRAEDDLDDLGIGVHTEYFNGMESRIICDPCRQKENYGSI